MLIPPAGVALPVVKTATDCAEFGRTVSPFLPQLLSLPHQVFQHISSFEELKTLYVSTNPLITALAIALALVPIFLIASEINKNYSQVDRFWSILPTVYNAHYCLWAHMNGLPTIRLDNIIAFSCVWSLRLTYNYWRKGGYSIGSEDYRWKVLRSKISPRLFFVFNVLFTSFAQSILLWAITTPTYVLLLTSRLSGPEATTSDIVFSRALMLLVLATFFADQQQWNFQQAKKQYQATAKVPSGWDRTELDRGFCTSGMFSYSRHPNFAAEQAIWVVLYQWSCFETFSYYNWTFCGALAYLFLFQASTWFTELITAEKYPEYKIYQRLVPKFLPNLAGPIDMQVVKEEGGAREVKPKEVAAGKKKR
ncbi:hypothetical protein H2201_001699 [Coniosporium apollinis]|uniref:DUF1295-domain-containing protein n=1 Tax=Coniosporium apollinis TaxID=61459 RepID=A0ABQ9P403_9PEZI|nr:hypothetical protein H2201_001699 [Coniosporium apollinis]